MTSQFHHVCVMRQGPSVEGAISLRRHRKLDVPTGFHPGLSCVMTVTQDVFAAKKYDCTWPAIWQASFRFKADDEDSFSMRIPLVKTRNVLGLNPLDIENFFITCEATKASSTTVDWNTIGSLLDIDYAFAQPDLGRFYSEFFHSTDRAGKTLRDELLSIAGVRKIISNYSTTLSSQRKVSIQERFEDLLGHISIVRVHQLS
jgi:hypothetical protein